MDFESVVIFFERLELDAVISLWQPGWQQAKIKLRMLDKSGKLKNVKADRACQGGVKDDQIRTYSAARRSKSASLPT